MKLSQLFSAQDMTVGSPVKKILQFAIPLLLGNIAQQLYNTVDSIVVGNFVGDEALAAVGNCGPILNLIIILFVGISTGVTIMVSQYYGAKQQENLSRATGTCMTWTLIASIFIMILGPIITGPLLHLLDTPDDIFDMCQTYLLVVLVGIAGGGYYNILSGVLRGLGDSLTALLALLVTTFLNIGLDLLFVIQFDLGVFGVALATVLAQFVSAIICIVRLATMRDVLTLSFRELIPERRMSLQLLKLGLPSGISQAIFSMSSLVVRSLINSFGTLVIACTVVVMRVDAFAMMPNFTFSNAMTTYTGQNIGAGKLDRVHKGSVQGTLLTVGCAALLTCGMLVFARQLMGLFTKTPELVDLGVHMIHIIAVGYLAFGLEQALMGVMRGAGDTVTPMWISMIATVGIRVPSAYLLAYLTKSPDSLYYSLLAAWVIGMIVTVICYKRGKWTRKTLLQTENLKGDPS